MPKLADVISTLVSQCAEARVSADLEAVKTALLYREHDILKHFSVPRMRIRDIDINLKVAVVSSGGVGAHHLQQVPINDTIAFIHETLARQFNLVIKNKQEYRAAVSPSLKDLNGNIQELSRQVDEGELEFNLATRKLQELFQYTAKYIVEQTQAFIEQKVDLSPLHKNLIVFFNEKAIVQKVDANNMEVEVNTAILKELPPDTLLSIKLNVFEEGYEIKLDDGKLLLVPE
ncbi:hypothetical protein [Thiothrix winogradskyi]|uniref:Uncharacterized protein n=1 Tax=Thiothrix winogradskyi TaxID=96472 RepID=A0ABY3T0Z1_9GAMM|nr:hypothetical protein [Thiothrix winogradskyi]UJS25068.1 hypothetical protein L2Y54_03265 [Thiothrix winogradskyi]